MLQKMHFPLLAAHWVRSIFEKSRKWQCHLLYHFRWQTPRGWFSVPSMRTTKGLHTTESHHGSIPVSPETPPTPCAIMCGSSSLDTPGWVGRLWMGQTHGLAVPEEQLQPFVLKTHGPWTTTVVPSSFIVAQYTVHPPASGRHALFWD